MSETFRSLLLMVFGFACGVFAFVTQNLDLAQNNFVMYTLLVLAGSAYSASFSILFSGFRRDRERRPSKHRGNRVLQGVIGCVVCMLGYIFGVALAPAALLNGTFDPDGSTGLEHVGLWALQIGCVCLIIVGPGLTGWGIFRSLQTALARGRFARAGHQVSKWTGIYFGVGLTLGSYAVVIVVAVVYQAACSSPLAQLCSS